jgi:methionine-rich copper-binding protein CopC
MRHILGHALALAALSFAFPMLRLDGHAILLSAAPAFNETVSATSVQVRLRFNSRIDVKRSRLILVLPGGRERVLTAGQPSPDTVSSDAATLIPGSYILRWQVLAEDGHITRGEVPFRAQ